MTAKKSTRRAAGASPSKSQAAARSPADPNKSLPFPATPDERIICAKSVVQAVLAAHDSGQDMGNYDIHWPLGLEIGLLDKAADQVGVLMDKQS